MNFLRFVWGISLACPVYGASSALVLQTDFGVKDGAVAAMKGVAFGVDSHLPIFDLSHENTPYDVWQASYRLKQTAPYWPAGTVFVSVVDPGVGTERKSVVLKTKTGHFFVGPDNGTWTHVAEDLGVESVRRIDERINRLTGSGKSYTFHGRDVYVYAGARLASGQILFRDVGPELAPEVTVLASTRAKFVGGAVSGGVPQLDFQFGNVWTDISDELFAKMSPKIGGRFLVTLSERGRIVYRGEMPFVRTFGDVPEKSPLLYLNSLLNVSFALNQTNFAQTHGISAGAAWVVKIEKAKE